jgi:peptide/nickel transport system ATP-binding protein
MPRCREELPPRIPIGDAEGHWAACWLYDEKTVQEAAR